MIRLLFQLFLDDGSVKEYGVSFVECSEFQSLYLFKEVPFFNKRPYLVSCENRNLSEAFVRPCIW